MSLKNNATINQILLGASVFFLPLWQILSIISWALLIMNWIRNENYRNVFQRLNQLPYLWFLIGFYCLHIIGLIWTTDLKDGLEDLQMKIVILILPIIFCTLEPKSFSLKNISRVIWASCFVASVICLVNAFNQYAITKNVEVFYYTFYSFLLHPTYFSMYMNLAVLLVIYELINEYKVASTKLKGLLFFLLIYFILNIILISARTSMAATFLSMPILALLEAGKKSKLKKALVITGISLLILLSGFYEITRNYDRFPQVSDAIAEFKQNEGKVMPDTYYNSTTIRLTLWQYGFNIYKRNWLIGVGTGDIKEESKAEFKRNKFNYGKEHCVSPHNQYLHTSIVLGLPGLILLMAVFLIPLIQSFKEKNYLIVVFIFIVMINALTETILRASGVLFFSFFVTYFYVYYRNKESDSSIQQHQKLK